VRVPKPHRVTDKALLKALRIGYCELCGRADMECGVHHIITKASGGGDARCNLICLCVGCHTAAHAGNITKEQLWAIVAAREGMTAEQLGQTCYGMELAPCYVDIIVKRWEQLTGKKAELVR
jgi:hypothetical protein